MIEIFKSWITSILCLGIFVTMIELIMPKSKLKKQVYITVGIITIITILQPVIFLINENNILASVENTLDGLNDFSSSNNTINTVDLVKEDTLKRLKNDVISRLNVNGIVVENVNIVLEEDYSISKMAINIAKVNKQEANIKSVTDIIEYIRQQYDIPYSKIEVIEKGE